MSLRQIRLAVLLVMLLFSDISEQVSCLTSMKTVWLVASLVCACRRDLQELLCGHLCCKLCSDQVLPLLLRVVFFCQCQNGQSPKVLQGSVGWMCFSGHHIGLGRYCSPELASAIHPNCCWRGPCCSVWATCIAGVAPTALARSTCVRCAMSWT